MKAAGANQRLYGPQGNLDAKVAEEFPDVTEGAVMSNCTRTSTRTVCADYRAALEKYDAPDLDWNTLAGLGTWTAYTAFTDIVEGMKGEITTRPSSRRRTRRPARHRRHARPSST